MIKVTVWNEYRHEKKYEHVRAIYPDGIHGCIKSFLETNEDITCRLAALDDEECGLTQEVIDDTDVLIWWGHMAHHEVPDHIVDRVKQAVHSGMGLVVLHSGHHSKIFKALMGTPCSLGWRENEVYAEPFSIPEPDKLVFAGWYEGGELFRSGCCYKRGHGNIFYFQPGHETVPTYHNKTVQTIITNAVRWAKPIIRQEITCPMIAKIERK